MLDAHQPFRDFVFPAVRLDGCLMYVKVSGKPCFDARGASVGVGAPATTSPHRFAPTRPRRRLREVQAELVSISRVTTLGELAASIAYEVNQPIAATLSNAQAALRWLRFDPPGLDEVRQTPERIVRDAARAGAVAQRIRDLVKKALSREDRVDINAAIRDVIEITRGEVTKNRVSLQTELPESLPLGMARYEQERRPGAFCSERGLSRRLFERPPLESLEIGVR
jgi:signal transduction histidine kinase